MPFGKKCKKLWKTTIFKRQINYKSPFSMAMLVYQRVSCSAVQLRLPVLPPRLAQLNSQPCADLSGQMAHQRAKTLQRTSAAKKCIKILHCDLFKRNLCIILTSF
jgi:hypothetical protein